MEQDIKVKLAILLEEAIKDKKNYQSHFTSLLGDNKLDAEFPKTISFEQHYRKVSSYFGLGDLCKIEFQNVHDEWFDGYFHRNEERERWVGMGYHEPNCVLDQFNKTLKESLSTFIVEWPSSPVISLTRIVEFIEPQVNELIMEKKSWKQCRRMKNFWKLKEELVLTKHPARMTIYKPKFSWNLEHGIFKVNLTDEEGFKFIKLYQDTYKAVELQLHTAILDSRLKEYKLLGR